jgi:hypothetical protein
MKIFKEQVNMLGLQSEVKLPENNAKSEALLKM